jgi:tetratricopeptide (TPR) repeat protein
MTRIARAGFLVCSLLALGCGSAEPPAEPEIRLVDDLGSFRRSVQASPEAQAYFDQGLNLTYGFNHDAAIRSYRTASGIDPECAMCYWGEALALGPNINAPMGPQAHQQAHDAIQKARATVQNDLERQMIDALAKRYDPLREDERKALDLDYANAMRELHRANPQDDDIATLFAASIMNLIPWAYYDLDGNPAEQTPELVAALESVLARNPQHPGANHYYIHAVEASKTPGRAEAAADRLASLVPGSGHLVHMPTHIYWRIGRYADAVRLNQRAVGIDETTFSYCGSAGFYGAAYYPHNIHFVQAAASAEGNSSIALMAARKLAADVEPKLVEFPFVEEYMTMPIVTLLRFGQWDAVLGEPKPREDLRYLTAIWHYARGIARVRMDELELAQEELDTLQAIAAEEAMHEFWISGGVNRASTLARIGVLHLEGELSAARGDLEAAVEQLTAAVEVQDSLAYMEPPPWYMPTRQALGAVLLDTGRVVEAEQTYRADLEQYPANGWSLFGLAASLRLQEREEDAELVEAGFEEAWARADVTLVTSRF